MCHCEEIKNQLTRKIGYEKCKKRIVIGLTLYDVNRMRARNELWS